MPQLLRLLIEDVWQTRRFRLIFLLVLMLASGFLEGLGMAMLLPLFGAIGLGDLGGAGHLSFMRLDARLSVLVPVIIVVFLVQYLVITYQGYAVAREQVLYQWLWRDRLYKSYMQSNWQFFSERKSSELTNSIVTETGRLAGAFFLLGQITTSVIVALVYFVLAVILSWELTVALMVGAVIIILATRWIARVSLRVGKAMGPANAELQDVTNETIGGAKLIKATSTEEYAISRFSRANDALRPLLLWSSFQPHIQRGIFEFGGLTLLVLILAFAVGSLGLDTATVVLVIALFVRLYPRLNLVQQNFQALNVVLPAVASARALLEDAKRSAEQLDSGVLPTTISCLPLNLRLEGLTIRFGKRAVLEDVSMSFREGSITGIVGKSGAGKSTLVDSLLHLVEPNSGKILVNGVSLTDLRLRPWRQVVGYVGQDTFLFNASIRDNIRWARPDASEEDVLNAAKKAAVQDFITDLPAGYETLVGDRGVRVSGGQKQRIGLARALLAHPKLLILDEATSALDVESEAEVLRTISALSGEMTILMIAHRLSTVRSADYIYLLDSGRIEEHGTWSDLLSRKHRFHGLWAMQSQV